MADIDIQKKKATVWPWIIGLAVMAALVILLLSYFRGDEDVREDATYTREGAIDEAEKDENTETINPE
ncbi:MAG: hypothetical protein M3Q97_08840 [Bacteroidota bacterium]|nr:hypothetical protein [Bacteroidota bacterium]